MSSLLIKPTSPRRVLRTGKSKKRGPKGYCRLICPWEKIRRETLFLCLVSEVGFRVPSEDIRVNAPVPHGKLVGHQPRHEDCFSPPNQVSVPACLSVQRDSTICTEPLADLNKSMTDQLNVTLQRIQYHHISPPHHHHIFFLTTLCLRGAGLQGRALIFNSPAISHPVLAGFRQRQPAVPRRAPKCLSLFT